MKSFLQYNFKYSNIWIKKYPNRVIIILIYNHRYIYTFKHQKILRHNKIFNSNLNLIIRIKAKVSSSSSSSSSSSHERPKRTRERKKKKGKEHVCDRAETSLRFLHWSSSNFCSSHRRFSITENEGYHRAAVSMT